MDIGHHPPPAAGSPPPDPRLVLNGGDWLLWPHFVLRSAGFPIAELSGLADSALASAIAAADQPEEAERCWQEAMRRTLSEALRMAGGERLRMALLWQNPPVIDEVIGWLNRHGNETHRRLKRRRRHERTLVKYLQRYHARNESIGFFGPVAWGTFVRSAHPVTAVPGRQVAADQRVNFEEWGVRAIGDALARDPSIRARLPFASRLDIAVHGGTLVRAGARPRRLSSIEMRVLSYATGEHTPASLAEALAADPAEVWRTVCDLAEEGVLAWSFDVPVDTYPERALRDQLAALRQVPAARSALAALESVVEAAAQACQAESVDDLAAALHRLGERFTGITGIPPIRNLNGNNRGRGLLHTQCRRDIDVSFGEPFWRQLAEPLALIMSSASWLCGQAAAEFESWALGLHRDLAHLHSDGTVNLGLLCKYLLPMTREPSRLDGVVADLERRWATVLAADPAASRLHYRAADLAAATDRAFSACPAAWHSGRHHSPDLMVAAEDMAAINRGDYQVVLGETHVGVITCDSSTTNEYPPAPEAILGPAHSALRNGPPLFLPLHTSGAEEVTGRNYPGPETFSERYRYLSFAARAGQRRAPGERVTPVSAVTVQEQAGRLQAVFPDGSRHLLLHVLGEYVTYMVSSRFHIMPTLPHTPRITVDRLVISRETWRIPAAELLSAGTLPEWKSYRHVRETACKYNLPRRTFWRGKPETKPVHLDLDSPLLVGLLLGTPRADEDATIVFSEMLPEPGSVWLPDAEGCRYASELRVTLVDARTPGSSDAALLP